MPSVLLHEEPEEAADSDFEVEVILPSIDIESMPVRSRHIPSEELEHTEDKYLDFEYEEALKRENDNLTPIPNGENILAGHFGNTEKQVSAEAMRAASSESRENNKAVEIATRMSEDVPDEGEFPELPENPTEQDLIDYASKHPAVKSVARLFRGKVVAVRKKS